MAVSYDSIYDEEYKKALGDSVDTLKQSQASAETSLKKSYDTSINKITQDKNKALKESYVSKMKEIRDAPSTLARQGLNGGMTETNQANIIRNYQNNRNTANSDYANNKTTLDVGYNGDLSSVRSTYADAINTARQNAIASAISNAANRYNILKAEEEAAAAQAASSGYSSSTQSSGASQYMNNSSSESVTPYMSYQNNNSLYTKSDGSSVIPKKTFENNNSLYTKNTELAKRFANKRKSS